ncbi:ABC transporter ATP-binding protein [Geodermatophilus chilensis]|uniref:ABC transporter ATP-binding protein n=1 Tax=Geodermatophilus chilensis TaxID=2035835 RepID=UPI000C2682AD|nr:ABC transporter ATP-binding protein [Geodermatophilus chilensis]
MPTDTVVAPVPDALVRVAGLRIHAPDRRGGAARELLSGVDLVIDVGERLGLVGASGAGKSLFARTLTGRLPSGLRVQGDVRVGAVDVLRAGPAEAARLRGRVTAVLGQHSAAALDPLSTVGYQVALPMRRLLGASRADARRRVLELLESLGFDDPAAVARARPPQLSGGQRQRAALAMALACRPRLLVADEPTTALDTSAEAAVLAAVRAGLDSHTRDGVPTALLLISHDLAVAASLCTRLAVLDHGRVVEDGSVGQLLTAPRSPVATAALAAAHRFASVGQPGRSPRHAARPGHPAGAGNLIEVHGLSRRYRTGRPGRRTDVAALDGVDLSLAPGRHLGVVGDSGAGKSTLLRLLLGLEEADTGEIRIAGRRVLPGPAAALRWLRHTVQVVAQDATGSLDPRMTVGAVVAEPLRLLQVPGDHPRRVAEMLTAVGLDPTAAHLRPGQFSGGQQQRIALARALAPRPRLLMADEPTSALDPVLRAHIVELLAALARQEGLQLLVVSHDLGVVGALCDDVAVLARGRVVEHGPVAQVLGRPRSAVTRRLLAAAPQLPAEPDPAGAAPIAKAQ